MRRPGVVLSRYDLSTPGTSPTRPLQHRRRLRPPTAGEDDEPFGRRSLETVAEPATASARTAAHEAHPDQAPVAGAFALAMAVVLAATSWFLYLRLESHLALSLDRELRLRAQDLTALAADPRSSIAAAGASRLVESGESYAQLITPRDA